MNVDEEITTLRNEIEALQQLILKKQRRINDLLTLTLNKHPPNKPVVTLTTRDITRYSRQILLQEMGVESQLKLKQSKVLIAGAGGLGCPAALYLAAAGVGHITVVDYDEVELSNLHRQILHSEFDIGRPKVDSAAQKLQSINTDITIKPLRLHLDSTSLPPILEEGSFDVVLDCSDNPPTRYLLNDCCVLSDVPLVSGSALQFEGQLTVYNHRGGPCYRCLYPVPPPPHTVTRCGDGGVLGMIAGTIGVLQALEAVKVLLDAPGVLSGKLLLFDGSESVFRRVRLRTRQSGCVVCGDEPTIVAPVDYERFCQMGAHDDVVDVNILNENDHVTPDRLKEALGSALVIDVRPRIEFRMCSLPDCVNVPFGDIEKGGGLEEVRKLVEGRRGSEGEEVFVLCRRGNDSQRAVELLRKSGEWNVNFRNVTGGLRGYAVKIDSSFPIY